MTEIMLKMHPKAQTRFFTLQLDERKILIEFSKAVNEFGAGMILMAIPTKQLEKLPDDAYINIDENKQYESWIEIMYEAKINEDEAAANNIYYMDR